MRAAVLVLAAAPTSATESCPETAQGWACPADRGCAGDACEGKWESWLAATNLFRCMHDVPFVRWSDPMYDDTKEHFKDQTILQHSNSFALAPPVGPAGENQLVSPTATTPLDSVRFWYNEVTKCPEDKAGCDGDVDQKKATGHYTTLIWQGVKELGCYTNEHELTVCRYRDGGATVGCGTPNMGGYYTNNVYAPSRTFESCKQALNACGLTVPDFSPKDYEKGEEPAPAPAASPLDGSVDDLPRASGAGVPTASMPEDAGAVARLAINNQGKDSLKNDRLWGMQPLMPGQTRPTPVVLGATVGAVFAVAGAALWAKTRRADDAPLANGEEE